MGKLSQGQTRQAIDLALVSVLLWID